jgi:hypothetical protein
MLLICHFVFFSALQRHSIRGMRIAIAQLGREWSTQITNQLSGIALATQANSFLICTFWATTLGLPNRDQLNSFPLSGPFRHFPDPT